MRLIGSFNVAVSCNFSRLFPSPFTYSLTGHTHAAFRTSRRPNPERGGLTHVSTVGWHHLSKNEQTPTGRSPLGAWRCPPQRIRRLHSHQSSDIGFDDAVFERRINPRYCACVRSTSIQSVHLHFVGALCQLRRRCRRRRRKYSKTIRLSNELRRRGGRSVDVATRFYSRGARVPHVFEAARERPTASLPTGPRQWQ